MYKDRSLDSIHSFLFAKRDKSDNLSFKGSVLLTESKDIDGGKVFIIRANNPRQTYISSMSKNSFNMFMDQTINTFKSYVDEYNKSYNDNARLLIIDDMTRESSTNREEVYDYYRPLAASGEVVKVRRSVETSFNGYYLDKKRLVEV